MLANVEKQRTHNPLVVGSSPTCPISIFSAPYIILRPIQLCSTDLTFSFFPSKWCTVGAVAPNKYELFYDYRPCRQPAMSNGRCRLHGGKCTGAKTAAGRKRLAEVNTKHGRCTKEAKAQRKAMRDLIKQAKAGLVDIF